MSIRVRFAPSPTGNVHIGNIRVAIFNWLYARHEGGKFLLRIEDTDLERSTPEAIKNLLDAMNWLGLDYDEEPVYQTAMRPKHEEAAKKMISDGHASCKGQGEPVVLHIHKGLFDSSFVTEPRDDAEINVEKGDLFVNSRCLTHTTTSSKGEIYTRPINWDALSEAKLITVSGHEISGEDIMQKSTAEDVNIETLAGEKVKAICFKRRYVFFDDLVMGHLEKPVDSIRDLVIVRSDGSPVFHLANVIDDAEQGITDILRGNDHVENTYRHLFLFQALGKAVPRYAHFPMIVNAQGKPYSKRDGDAYVGDFKSKGVLPHTLFNFLALCGWAPGDDREVMTKQEMIDAFSLTNVHSAPAQFNLEKLDWMNGQYLTHMPTEELLPLIFEELAREGLSMDAFGEEWLIKLIGLEKERIRTVHEFVQNTRYFFSDSVELNEKAVKKVLQKNDGAGLDILRKVTTILSNIPDWTESALEAAVHAFLEENDLKIGLVAQPLRVAVTGNTVSPGIWETLFLIGKERSLARIATVLNTVTASNE